MRDKWIPPAIVGSLGNAPGEFLSQLVKSEPGWRRNPQPGQIWLLVEAAAAMAARNDENQLAGCLALLAVPRPAAVGPGDLAMLSGLAQGLADRGQSLRAALSEGNGPLEAQRGDRQHPGSHGPRHGPGRR